MKVLNRTLTVLFLITIANSLLMAQWAPLATDANAKNRIEWLREARFGLLIHWGLYAIPARGEWIQWNDSKN